MGNLYGGNSVIFGREGDYLFVNSAQSLSADRVDEIFPGANWDGSVRLEDIFELIRQDDNQANIGDTVIGRIAIRRVFELEGQKLKGESYTKRHANNILNDADFIRVLKGQDGSLIPYSDVSSLSNFTLEKYRAGQNKHRSSLDKARSMKITGSSSTAA